MRLLHAEGSVRARLRLPAAGARPFLRGDHAPGWPVRRPRRPEAPHHRRRTARAPEPARAHRDARGSPCPDGDEPIDLTLTTNGAALRPLAVPLREAGLQRVTVSLDSLDDDTFRSMNGVDFPAARVVDGIAAAREAGLAPIKINMVVKRGLNESSILPMARWARETGAILRVIEYMDVGHSNGWRMDDVVPAAEVVELIDREMPIELLPPNYEGEVALRWRYRDGSGEVGLIASVTQPFCGTCTRARLSAEGKLYTCLFAVDGFDLRGLLRSGASDDDIVSAIAGVWRARDDRYSELRSAATTNLPK